MTSAGTIPGYTATVLAILRKDLTVELRSRETIATMTMFAVVVALLFAFGFASELHINRTVLPAVLWSTLLFSGTLGIGRTFARENKDGAFVALIGAPAERSAVLMAKTIINLVLMAMVMVVVVPLLAVMLQIDLTEHAGILAFQLLLGAAGFAFVGTPLAVMAVNARFAEVLLPLVVFPLVSPVLISGVRATGVLLGTTAMDTDPWQWMNIIVAFDAVYGVGGLFLFERMVTE